MPPPEAIAAIEALPWVTDGRTEYESYIVGRLQRLSAESQNVFLKLMDKPWLTSNECRSSCPVMIHYVIQMSGADETAAAHILDLEFIETLEYSTAELSLEFLRDVLLTEPVRFWNLLSHQRFDTNIREGRIESVALLYLELEDPDSAAQLEALPWVQDGVDRGEVEWLVRLARLGATSRPFLQAVLAKERVWLPPGPSPHMASLRLLASISAIDAELAIRVMELPFLATIERHDYEALLSLAGTAASDLSLVEEVLSHLAVAGTSPEDTPLAILLFALGREDPAAREALDALPWIQDGVGKSAQANEINFDADPSTLEEYIVFELFRMHQRSRQLFSVLVSKPWLQDGLDGSEVRVFSRISDLAGADTGQTLIIASMPFLDTVEGSESGMLEWLFSVERADHHDLKALLAHPELVDGIRDGDRVAVNRIILELQQPAVAAEIDALPWVQDGVDDSEQAFVHALRLRARDYARSPAFQALIRKPWVRDGLSEPEWDALFWLLILSRDDVSVALKLANMPFLESVDSTDSLVVHRLAIAGPESIESLFSHPALQGGITNAQAPLLSAVLTLAGGSTPLDMLLDPQQTIVETRRIDLPLAGEVVLSVVWPGGDGTMERASRAMDLLEHAIRTQEEFMRVRYPRGHAILQVTDRRSTAGGRGLIAVSPRGAEYYERIAHEAARTYWNTPPRWLQEATVRFMGTISVGTRTGEPLPEPIHSCSSVDNISGLLRLMAAEGVHYSCADPLGEAMFLDLYRTIGDEAFREGFGTLYAQLRDNTLKDECLDVEWGACNVKAAFLTDATPEHAAAAEAIINRRYYGIDD